MLSWPYWLVLFLVIVPATAFVLSRRSSRIVCRIGWGLIGFGCLNWLILELASKLHWPLNPEWLFAGGIVALFCGLGTFLGIGIRKITTDKTN